MGLSVVDLVDSGELPKVAWYRRDIVVFGGRLSLNLQAQLAAEMATILRARLPVLEMLRILSKGDHGQNIRTRLNRVAQQVAEGTNLADAFMQSGPQVSPVFVAVLQAGEQSDALPEQLADLAVLLRRLDHVRSQVATALIYPAILIAAAIAVVLIVSQTLAPALVPLFEAQNVQPPSSVVVLFSIGEVIADYWPWILAGIAASTFVAFVVLKASWGEIVRRMPVFGAVAQDAALLTLLRTLALLLKGGHPLADSLRAVAEFDSGAPFAATASAAADALERGGRAHEALAADRRLPATVRELFRVGEEANSLIPVLETLAASQADRLERRIQRLLSILTPILTLAIGAAVGWLVYTIMDAVFSINALAV